MEQRDTFVAWAERVEAATCLFNSARIVKWNTHKSYLRDLEAAGVPVVATEWLDRGSTFDLADLLRRRDWTHGFIKPAIGATARETLRFEADGPGLRAAEEHLRRTLAREDMMLQPYLPSVETEGEYSAIFIGDELTHAVRKIPGRATIACRTISAPPTNSMSSRRRSWRSHDGRWRRPGTNCSTHGRTSFATPMAVFV